MTDQIQLASISPRHEVRDSAKLESLAAAMSADGWQGRPLLLKAYGDGWVGLTGSHRYAAAKLADLESVPAITIEDEQLDADQWDDLNAANDDDDLLALLVQFGLDDAADLMRQEMTANEAERK